MRDAAGQSLLQWAGWLFFGGLACPLAGADRLAGWSARGPADTEPPAGSWMAVFTLGQRGNSAGAGRPGARCPDPAAPTSGLVLWCADAGDPAGMTDLAQM
jgi:hypothetical protein